MKNNCKLCWIILGLFLLGNIVVVGVWFLNDNGRERNRSRTSKSQGSQNHKERIRKHLMEDAGINNDQFEDIYKLMKVHFEGMHIAQQEIDSLRHLLMDQTFSNNNDSIEVNNILDLISLKQRDIDQANYYHFKNVRGKCNTDEQRQMFDKMFRSRMMPSTKSKRFRGNRHK
ncbi:hypothetical protein [Carboxylicivirga sp. M1479]|uniref:hypothetical protein n=1 Tax=Carboxylicivirga sp. M1479 TaxID=2594476 RepID=UPI001177F073|nr:hypothetical protein [Carboxylicivirga sp. M1479]TRX66027.1 hypothetical protein FNN09_15610 [Carboxylicivirga sp. M1479]